MYVLSYSKTIYYEFRTDSSVQDQPFYLRQMAAEKTKLSTHMISLFRHSIDFLLCPSDLHIFQLIYLLKFEIEVTGALIMNNIVDYMSPI